jgi:UDP-N-acetylmuramate--alanine ligase
MSKATKLGRINHIHFVGIGGAGMCGIAEVLLNEGYKISGSDTHHNSNTDRLIKLGAQIFIGHTTSNIAGADVLVKSTSIKNDNPEIIAAHENHIPVVPRAQMLGELMRFRYGIAISGTHGKTTTTSLVTSVLSEANLDPTFVIGGLLNSAGTNAKLGTGKFLVAEADESDASFLYLHPMMTVVTNIDVDHMETYGGNFETLRKTFLKFLENLPFYGIAILCIDDPIIRQSLAEISRPMRTYGFSADADISVIPGSCRHDGWMSHFSVKRRNATDLTVSLKLPGDHNILNACAAIAVAHELGIDDDALVKALENFSGVGRRLQHHGDLKLSDSKTVHVLDDYGHHPREVAVTLEALRRAYPGRRVVMVFQPHRYTRTRDLFQDFAEVLSKCDELCLLDIYSAGESAIPGISSEHLANAIRGHKKVNPILLSHHSSLQQALSRIVQDQDILLMQGAGNIGTLAKDLFNS